MKIGCTATVALPGYTGTALTFPLPLTPVIGNPTFGHSIIGRDRVITAAGKPGNG
jgi:hypothetical protein